MWKPLEGNGFLRTVVGLLALAGAAGAMWLRSPPGGPSGPRCVGQRFDLIPVPGGLSPYIRLEAGGRAGAFLLDTGASASSVSAAVYGERPGGAVQLSGLSLPTFPGGRFLTSAYHIANQPTGGQLGIIGTDFLGLLTADFTFRPGGGDVVLGAPSCDRAGLEARGLRAVKQNGFFSSDPRRVAHGRANVPVLYVRIGGVATWAQIDTGYDDAITPVIDINAALYQRLIASGALLARDGDVPVTACDGPARETTLRVKSGGVRLETDGGDALADVSDVRLVLKPHNTCGGIATMDEPAAQIGMSTLRRLGVVVFDPKAELVWVRPQMP